MDDDARRLREAAIYDTAYDLLAKHGYGGTSMLRVAQAAKASNETLYRWYGDKDGLFTAMVRANAKATRQMLTDCAARDGDAWETLSKVAAVFLRMILGDRAILLNRAAAADPTGALGAAIAAGGRDEVMPLLSAVLEGVCAGTDVSPSDAAEWFIGLLVADLQVRRIIHQRPAPDEEEIAARCDNALRLLGVLIGRQTAQA